MQQKPNNLLERALRRWKKPSGNKVATSIDMAPSSGFDVLIQ
jgi:hypothetical protein